MLRWPKGPGSIQGKCENKNRGVRITVSTSCFVPKPMTPFQWEKQDTPEEFERKQQLIKDNLRTRAIHYSWHNPQVSLIEAVLARGDRRTGAVLEAVYKKAEDYRPGMSVFLMMPGALPLRK